MAAIPRMYNIVSSIAATAVRAGYGGKVLKDVGRYNRPQQLMTLYLKESCPFSRKVREACSILDLDVNIKPCPLEGTRFRPELKQIGGKEQVPLLVDPNTNTKLYESNRIVNYLFKNYGSGEEQVPMMLQDGYISTGTSRLATLFRSLPWHGLVQYKGDDATSLATLIPRQISSKAHDAPIEHSHIAKPLHLFNYEASPFCRLVREALDSLEIPYVVHNHAPGSLKRPDYVKMSGKMQFPFLIDDNNGKRMFESAAIIEYLYKNYSPKKK